MTSVAPRGWRGLGEIAAAFLTLGCTSFGGPVAHLGYLRAEFVDKRAWLDDAAFLDLVALCQFLPGPASSQVVYGIGLQRAGLAGALIASFCFTAPSALLMIAFAVGIADATDLRDAGWLHGLAIAAVAVVAAAVRAMATKLCATPLRAALCLGAAATLLLAPGPWTQVLVIAVAAGLGWQLERAGPLTAEASVPPANGPRPALGWRSTLPLLGLGALLLGLPALARVTGSTALAVADGFVRAGALVFGGGHVVLPLLHAEVVPTGWVDEASFLAGYGAAQAVPGPLFTFASYLGAAMRPSDAAWLPSPWLGGLWTTLAIFAPSWLLVSFGLPVWQRLRRWPTMQRALAGSNAAVVGLLLAAWIDPIAAHGVRGVVDAGAALAAWWALDVVKAPPWAVVLGMAACGQWLLPLVAR